MQFYLPSDAKSHKFKDGFLKVAQRLKAADVKVGVVDCDRYEETCAAQGFRSYPAFKFYFGGKSKPFDETSVSSKALLQFVHDSIPNNIVNLRLTGQMNEFFQSKKISVVYVNPKYETPTWWRAMGYRYQDKAALGEIRGPNDKLHQYLHISKAPSINVYCGDKDASETFAGDVNDTNAIFRFMDKLSPNKCKDLVRKAQQMQSNRKQAAQKAKRLSESELQKKRVSELRDIVTELGIPLAGLLEKVDFVRAILGAQKVSVEL